MVQIKHLKLELTCIIILAGINVDMYKSWIWSASRLSAEYENRVEEFLRFAMVNSENRRLLRCTIPAAHFTMSKEKKMKFRHTQLETKVP